MRVVLFRHGIAGSRDPKRWPDDGLRPLTSRGRERTAHAARGLARILDLSRILSSPLVRASQTAEIVKDAFDMTCGIETLIALRPGGPAAEVVARLRLLRPTETIALVGHEPDLGKLAGVLLFGSATHPLPMKKAGACIIDFVGKPEPGRGKLLAFLPPRLLRRRSRKKASS